ncbi:MAG TPA: extracellular solute-binding protein [Limnochordia bacterium]
MSWIRWLWATAGVAALVFGPGWAIDSAAVTVWSLPGRTPQHASAFGAGMKAAVDAFAEAHPGIALDITEGADLDRLLTAIAGGAPPDVAAVDRFLLASLAREGYFIPLDQWAQASRVLRPESMPPGAWEELHGFDGRLYGVPMLADNVGFWSLYYNRRLMAEGGIDPSHAPYRWDEFRAVARKLTRRDGDGRIVQLGYRPDALDIHHFGRANRAAFVSDGGRRITLNAPAVVRTLEFLADQVHEMGGWPEISTSPAFAGGLGFLNGTIGMRSHGEWFL